MFALASARSGPLSVRALCRLSNGGVAARPLRQNRSPHGFGIGSEREALKLESDLEEKHPC
jgi:hypothetical protein